MKRLCTKIQVFESMLSNVIYIVSIKRKRKNVRNENKLRMLKKTNY